MSAVSQLTHMFIYAVIAAAVVYHYLGEAMSALKKMPKKIFDTLKDGLKVSVKWLANHRWRGTRAGRVKDQGLYFVNFAPHPKRVVSEVTLRVCTPWRNLPTFFGLWYNVSRDPSPVRAWGYSIPYLFGIELEVRYYNDWWEKKHGLAWPRHYCEYSFAINGRYVTYIHGDYMDRHSWEFEWPKYLKGLFIKKHGVLEEEGDWYSCIAPIPAAGTWPAETIRLRCKKLVSRTHIKSFGRKRVEEKILWSVDLGDGVTVPGDNDVYADAVFDGVTVEGVNSHQEAMSLIINAIVNNRKRRPENENRSMQQ